MNKQMSIIVTSVVVLIIAIIVVVALMNKPQTGLDSTQPTDTPLNAEQEQTESEGEQTSGTTITYTDSGFSPESLTVKVGTVVTVKNQSSDPLEFSSADHPTHTKQAELNLAVIEPGGSATFTPTKVGTWGFHDHLNSGNTGTLIVVE